MKPGDVVSCACGAQGNVWTTGAQHLDGWPVLVTWPCGRTAVESTKRGEERPPTCLRCEDKRLGLPTPNLPPFAIPQFPPTGAGEGPLNESRESSGAVKGAAGAGIGNKAPLERPSDRALNRAAAKVQQLTAQLGLGI